MAINYRKHEQTKLEGVIDKQEHHLKKKEKIYDENIALLSGYIDEIKLQFDQASKKAQEAAATKNESLKQIKDLETEIEQLKSDVSKKCEVLDVLKQYKAFVRELTPSDLIQVSSIQATKTYTTQNFLKQSQSMIKQAGINKTQTDFMPEDDNKIHLNSPAELHNVILQLEKENLYKIERKQEIEQEYEEIKSQFQQTKQIHGQQRKTMKEMIDQQFKFNQTAQERFNQHQIRKIELEKKTLDQDRTLQIEKKIEDLFTSLTLQDPSNVPTAIDQLSELENLLTKYIQTKYDLENECFQLLKDRESFLRRERQRVKILKNKQQDIQDDIERRLIANQRKNRIIKKGGKKVMFKSKPIEKDMLVHIKEQDVEDLRLLEFLNEDI